MGKNTSSRRSQFSFAKSRDMRAVDSVVGWRGFYRVTPAAANQLCCCPVRSTRLCAHNNTYADDQGRAGAEVDELMERVGARELMAMHIDALFTHDAQGRMVRV